jgi:cob(I)alamin adenosyltransferase
MKVYTKTGDKGETSLFGGTRVSKGHLRIHTYGTVDEVNSYIGLLRDLCADETRVVELVRIQDRLFTLGAILATESESAQKRLPKITQADIRFLEEAIDAMENELEPIKSFVLPGGHPTVSYCHIARCVCRRAERLTVELGGQVEIDELVIKYLNRLSDYLFVLSRFLTKILEAKEIAWLPEKVR